MLFGKKTKLTQKYDTLKDVVIELRRSKGWTQSNLAKKAHLSEEKIMDLESGRILSMIDLIKVSNAFNLELDEMAQYIDMRNSKVNIDRIV